MIIPLKHHVLLAYEPEPQKKSAIIVPEAHQKRSTVMRVVAMGRKAPAELRAGMLVSVLEYGGTLVKRDGQEYRLIHGDDVLGVFG